MRMKLEDHDLEAFLEISVILTLAVIAIAWLVNT